MSFYIHIQETPNPNAVKFISQYTVKGLGKSNYSEVEQAEANPLAIAMFGVAGVKQLFFFDNYITVTKDEETPWEDVSEPIHDLLQDKLPLHDPLYEDEDTAVDFDSLPAEIREIELVLDRTVRPFLAADGGGIEVLERKDNHVYVKFSGACGTCPSSFSGTMTAIESTLRAEIDDEIRVIADGMSDENAWW